QQSLVQTTRYFPKNRIARFDDCFAAERSLRQLLQGRGFRPASQSICEQRGANIKPAKPS
ncbi:hypothetical protein, partial [Pseudomonas prosekii]|uniref:hypothetical protein n=1 Tax=Pseudomonas prosekii TaxID=1148509 RepID=UPI001C635688